MADYDPFAAHHDVWAAEMTDHVQWYVSLAADAPRPIAELAVAARLHDTRIEKAGGYWERNRFVAADNRLEMVWVARTP